MTVVVGSAGSTGPVRGRDRAGGTGPWVALSVGSSVVSQLGILVVIGRSLAPEAVGLASALLAVITLPRIVSESVLTAPVVQRPNLDRATAGQGATLAVGTSVVLALLLAGGGGLIGSAFSIDGMEGPIRLIAIAVAVNGLAVVPHGLLQRGLEFRQIGLIDASAMLGGFLGGGLLALSAGAGPAAVAVAYLAESVVRCTLTMARAPVRPSPRLDRQTLGALGSYAGMTGLGSLLNLIATRGDYLIVARSIGPVPLAAYAQAYQLAYNPSLVVGRMIGRWLFPVLSRRQERPEQARQIFLGATRVLGYITGAGVAATVILAPVVIGFLFGDRWDLAVRPLQILALGIPSRVMYTLCDAQAKASGRVLNRAAAQAGYAASVVVLVGLGATISLEWAAAGAVGAIVVNHVLMLRAAGWLGGPQGSWHEVLRAAGLVPIGLLTAGLPILGVVVALRGLGLGGAVTLVPAVLVGGLTVGAGLRPILGALRDDPDGEVGGEPAPSTGPPPAPRIVSLLTELESAGVDAVLHKGQHRSERALSGEGDLDLHLPAGHACRAADVLEAAGFVPVAPARWREIDGQSDWLGAGPAGRLLHVQMLTELTLGSLHSTRIVMARPDLLIDRAVGSVPRMANPVDGAVVRLVEAVATPTVAGGRSAATRLAEARRLSSGIDREVLGAAASELFADDEVGRRVVEVVDGVGPGRLRRHLIRHHSRPTGSPWWPLALLASIVARLNRSTVRAPILPRRRLTNAPMVAIIGSDGSGKSTVTRRVAEALDDKIDTRLVYFGTGDGPASWLRSSLVVLRRLRDRRRGRAGTSPELDPNGPVAESPADAGAAPSGVPRAALMLWAITTARERAMTARRSARAVGRGVVVVADRFPQSQVVGIMDGPRLRGSAARGAIGRRMARWEQERYRRLVGRSRPDLVILLDVTVDVAMARRPDESRAELERRIDLARTIDLGGRHRVVIDATQDLDRVLELTMTEILESLR